MCDSKTGSAQWGEILTQRRNSKVEALSAMSPEEIEELFGPTDAKVEIELMGRTYSVPRELSILRALHYIELVHEGISIDYTRLCWNNRCRNCLVEYETRNGRRKIHQACQMAVCPELRITAVPMAREE